MSRRVKLRKIGNSLGIVLPKELLANLSLDEGDALFASRTPEGILLTCYDPDTDQALEAARDFMHRYPNAMKKLAGT